MSEHLQANEIINQLADRHNWTDDDQVVKLKLRGLKSLIEQAWREGNKIGREVVEEQQTEPLERKEGFGDMFGGMFDGMFNDKNKK